MFGGKRCASCSKVASICGIRTRSPESEFHGLGHDYTVHCSFSGQETGLAAVVVVRGCSAQIEGGRAANHGRKSVVAKTVAVGPWGVSEMPHDILIRRYQSQGARSEGHEPVSILRMQMQRTGPDRFLIC
jgi:hypothetical protein